MEETFMSVIFGASLLGFIFVIGLGIDGAVCAVRCIAVSKAEAKMAVGAIGGLACCVGLFYTFISSTSLA